MVDKPQPDIQFDYVLETETKTDIEMMAQNPIENVVAVILETEISRVSGSERGNRKTRQTCVELHCRRVSAVVFARVAAAVDDHVTSSWYLVSVSPRRVSLGYQLRQPKLSYVDGSGFRLECNQQIVRAVRRRYARLHT